MRLGARPRKTTSPAEPAASGPAGACFAGPATTKSAAMVPSDASPQLAAARRDYLNAAERAQRAEAEEAAKNTNRNQEEAQDLASEAHYSRREADEAFGYLARMADAEGYRACLCGKLERKNKR